MTDTIAWLGNPETRILNIREFRKFIDTLPFEDAVKITQKNWESGPKINKDQFDIGNIDGWPNPWELFSQNMFCANAQALGCFYTLTLSKHRHEHDIALAIINDIIMGERAELVLDNYPLTNIDVVEIVKTEDIHAKLGE